MRGEIDLPDLITRARRGEHAATARLISLVENDSERLPEIARLLAPATGHARVVGLTGSPGVGKSTSTTALIAALRGRGDRVGVLAVDPSSPFTGGALLGDRVRMSEHATDEGVFIRSMAARGHLGGLAAAVPQAVRVLDAVGFDIVLVETVGVGQSEVEIVSHADTVVVLLAPGMGDGIQAAKAGVLEIADVYVVNKADRDGAQQLARQLRQVQTMAGAEESDRWRAPVVLTVAARREGIEEVLAAIGDHAAWLRTSGEGPRRRLRRARDEVEALALAAVRRRFLGAEARRLDELATAVAATAMDPFTAAAELLDEGSAGGR